MSIYTRVIITSAMREIKSLDLGRNYYVEQVSNILTTYVSVYNLILKPSINIKSQQNLNALGRIHSAVAIATDSHGYSDVQLFSRGYSDG